jgi:FkbM family methyltransferase
MGIVLGVAKAVLARPMRAALARYPLYSGAATLVQRAVFRRLVPAADVTTVFLRDGSQIVVKTHDYIGRTIVLTGDYDRKITWLCQQVLRPGDTMLDVGANLGVVTMYAARMVGPTGTVHAFEPQAELVDLIGQSVGLNGYDHVTVHPVAMSDADREGRLFASRGNLGSATLGADGPDPLVGTVTVRRAADVLGELDLRPIRMLKLDIEGHEEPFLRGALGYLESNTPDVIAFESHDKQPFIERPVAQMLSGLGYEFFQIPKALLSVKLVPLAGRDADPGFDYVGIQPNSGLGSILT